MSSPPQSTTLIEISRINAELNRLITDVQNFRNLVTGCDNQTVSFKETRRRQEETIDNWKSQYRRMAGECKVSDTTELDRDFKVPVSDRIRRLDVEAHDLAVLASELVRFLSPADLASISNMDGDDFHGSVRTAEEPDRRSEQEFAEDYVHFVIVDENGQPLGGRESADKTIATNAEARNSSGYVSLQVTSADSFQEDRGFAEPVHIRNEYEYVGPGRRNSSVFGDNQRRDAAVEVGDTQTARYIHPYLQGNAARSEGNAKRSVAQSHEWRVFNRMDVDEGDQRTVSVRDTNDKWWKAIGTTTVTETAKRIPAYSVLNDQNEFILVPILNIAGDCENRVRYAAGPVGMTEAQRLWQEQLDCSSGHPIWYNLIAATDTVQQENMQPLADQEATTIAKPLTSMLSDAKNVSPNVKRSLLHQVLVEHQPRGKGQ